MNFVELFIPKNIGSGLAVVLLAALHIIYPFLQKTLDKNINALISFSSGIALGYVFLYMLPKLSDFTMLTIQQSPAGSWEFINYRTYFFVLIGLVIYFVIDLISKDENKENEKFKLINFTAFCLYSILLGNILANIPRPGISPIVLATIILGFHFFGINHHLFHWNQQLFMRQLRWWLALSLIVGWIFSILTQLPKEILIATTAFLSGAIIANVMFEELAWHRPTLRPFLTGVIAIIAIVAVMRSIPKIIY